MQKKELSKKQIFVISLISLIFLAAMIGADLFLKAGPMEKPMPPQTITETLPDQRDYTYARINSSLELVAEDSYEPGPAELNLAYFYPEGADESNVINSYAGQLYTELSTLEAKYLASFYDLIDISPVAMAKRKNMPASAFTGKYNPNDPSHRANDPESWTINSFKNINVSFYNGDDRRINGYSAVQEIMSLASVYSYYHDMYDAEAMREYALELFESCHTDSIHMSEVYYCPGCLNKTIEQEAEEAIEEELRQQQLEAEISSGLSPEELTGSGSAAGGSSQKVPASADTITEPVTYETVPETQQYVEGEVYVQGSIIIPELSLDAESDGSNGSVSSGESYIYEDESTIRKNNGGIPSGIETMPQSSVMSSEITESSAIEATDGSMDATASTYSSLAEVPSTAEAETEAAAAQSAPVPTPSPANAARRNTCPGHVDLNITIRIKGIDDKKGLFSIDKTGNSEDSYNDSWHGWTDDKIAQAKLLNSYNWIDKYGLTLSAIEGGAALSGDEIEAYMDRLPAGLSAERKAVVRFALESVGRVPYYWGGKPDCAGYEGNDFSSIISPDYKGRLLKGLDCSGWVNWVYWSALSKPLDGESTGTLIGLGKRIKRKDLRPGDIVVRTGPDAHVVMFLEWTTDGKMMVVHETGGVINNVVVSELTANWPYYRALLD